MTSSCLKNQVAIITNYVLNCVYEFQLFAIDKDIVEREAFMDFLICLYQLSTVGEAEHKDALEMKGLDPFDGKDYFESVIKSCVSNIFT